MASINVSRTEGDAPHRILRRLAHEHSVVVTGKIFRGRVNQYLKLNVSGEECNVDDFMFALNVEIAYLLHK